MNKPMRLYEAEIRNATTKAELSNISYMALRDDEECTVFSKKYDRIIALCVMREIELGL